MLTKPRTALFILLATVAVSAHAFTEPEELEVAQMLRYVLSTTEMPGRLHLNAVMAGRVEYGEEFRHPHDPPGPALVDCQVTQLVGVRYRVKRPRKHQYKWEYLDMQVRWTHSAVASENKALDEQGRLTFHKSQFRIFPLVTLELFDEIRVDGILSVEVSVGERVIMRNSFELSGCSENNQP